MTSPEATAMRPVPVSRNTGSGAVLPGDQFDAVIVGAGAAGLSLACHLAHAGWGDKVLIVDDAAHPLEGRSWAWWTTGSGLLDSAASAEVHHLLVAGTGWRRCLELAPYSYRRISGPELSAATDGIIGARPGYRRWEGSVRALTQEGDRCTVTIDVQQAGTTRTIEVSARWVFDSVGPGTSTEAPSFGMHLDFLGLHVECPTGTFEPGTATLMDFRTDQSSGVAFMYVLPTSDRSALVERTVFARPRATDSRVTECGQEELVVEYLSQCLGVGNYQVAGREVGVIPLDRRPRAAPSGSVIPIGARAGMVKASTGYGFERIQRHSAAIASCLSEGRSPAHATPTHVWNRALDNALLTVLRDDPDDAVSFFETLLTRNPVQRVLAFLDEDASLRAQLRLFATLPMAPFARSQVRAVTPRLRRADHRVPGRVLRLPVPRRGR